MQPNPGQDAPRQGAPLGPIEARLLALEAQTQTQQSRLRDQETALVERIADVDDDHRRAAAQLKRAIEAARDEQEHRARGRTRWLVVGLALASIIGLAAVALALYLGQARQQEVGGLAELRGEVDGIARLLAQGAAREDRLSEVEARIAELGERLAVIEEDVVRALTAAAASERSAQSQERARLSGEIERLEAVQADLAAGLGAAQRELAARIDAAPQAAPGEPTAAPPAEAQPTPVEPSAPPQDAPPSGPSEPLASEHGPSAEAAEVVAVVPESGLTPDSPPDLVSAPPTLITQGRVYALQLIGFHDLERLHEYALQAPLEAPVWRLVERYRGRPWYPLIQGLYPDYAAAQAARAQLPEVLQVLEPWIRPLPEGTELWALDPSAEVAGPDRGAAP